MQTGELAAALHLMAPLQFSRAEVEALYAELCSYTGARPRPRDIAQWPAALHSRDLSGKERTQPRTSPVKTTRGDAGARERDASWRRDAEAALSLMRDRLVSNKGLTAGECPGKVRGRARARI